MESLKAIDIDGQCASCQINYSLLNRAAEKDILPYCRENNIGVLLRGPIAQGLLADKFDLDTQFDDVVRQKWNPGGNQRDDFVAKLEKVRQLRELVPEGSNMVDFALKFVLANPAVTCPIPGMKTPEQAGENAAAATGELKTKIMEQIEAICPV